VTLDGAEELSFPRPLLFTVANLTQYGGGARVAPQAQHDDGILELVTLSRDDAPRALTQLPRLFDGTMDRIHGVMTRRFKTLSVHRNEPAPLQLDGELVEAEAEVDVAVIPKALTVLVPRQRN
jgi:diacylglycerol kinase family enzyme